MAFISDWLDVIDLLAGVWDNAQPTQQQQQQQQQTIHEYDDALYTQSDGPLAIVIESFKFVLPIFSRFAGSTVNVIWLCCVSIWVIWNNNAQRTDTPTCISTLIVASSGKRNASVRLYVCSFS